jgi:hypothetical protein
LWLTPAVDGRASTHSPYAPNLCSINRFSVFILWLEQVPARIVDSDFVGSNWQGAPAPVMMGGEGPWHDYAHACAIHSGRVFLAGVFTVGTQAPASNSLGSLALPAAAGVAPSAALPPAVIAGISLAVLAHLINFAAVVYFVRRHCSPAPSRIFIWCLVAFFFSGHFLFPFPL